MSQTNDNEMMGPRDVTMADTGGGMQCPSCQQVVGQPHLATCPIGGTSQ
jgi:hypothetical protein